MKKIYWKLRIINPVYFHHFSKKENKNKTTDRAYLILFRPLPKTDIFFLSLVVLNHQSVIRLSYWWSYLIFRWYKSTCHIGCVPLSSICFVCLQIWEHVHGTMPLLVFICTHSQFRKDLLLLMMSNLNLQLAFKEAILLSFKMMMLMLGHQCLTDSLVQGLLHVII